MLEKLSGMATEGLTAYIMEQVFTKVHSLVQNGYRTLDKNTMFYGAYENACKEYKNKHGEDSLYKKLYVDNADIYYDVLKTEIDSSIASRELLEKLTDIIKKESLDISSENAEEFIIALLTELYFVDMYRDKLFVLRQDIEIGKINKKLEEIITILYKISKGSFHEKVKFSGTMFTHYLNKWNTSLFLHREAEYKASLSNTYIVPFYEEESRQTKKVLKNLDERIDIFLNDDMSGNKRQPIVVLADAGMGKSSLVSYICSRCPQKENLLVLRFNDLEETEKNRNDESAILNAVIDKLECKREDLQNQRLIIDGYDESRFTRDDKTGLLKDFFSACKNIPKLKVLITSRINYIDSSRFENCSYKRFFLQYMTVDEEDDQIREMAFKYFKATHEESFEICNTSNEFIGVPLILYMVLSLKIHIEENMGICELYEKIFAFDGGIYDRMACREWDGYGETAHRISYTEIKKGVHLISQLIAFRMFEKNSLLLEQEEYTDIVKSVPELKLEDFLISNYYYIESSTYSLQFCHKTIYEYFLAEYIYNKMGEGRKENTLENVLAYLLKKNLLPKDMLKFLIYKIKKNYKDDIKLCENITAVVHNMISFGMTYFLDEKIKNVLEVEKNIFVNILSLLDVIYKGTGVKEYKDIDITSEFRNQLNIRPSTMLNLEKIRIGNEKIGNKNYVDWLNLNESYMDNLEIQNFYTRHSSFISVTIKNSKLNESYFSDCKFEQCIWENIDVVNTEFIEMEFTEAILQDVDFKDSKLSKSKFTKAKLKNVSFRGCDLRNADFKGIISKNLNLRDAINVNSIIIDENSIFEDAIVAGERAEGLLTKLIAYGEENAKGIKVYDAKTRKELSVQEYWKKRDSENKTS